MESDDLAVRPTTWNEFIGQESLKQRVRVHIAAARNEGRALEHIMLTGPPGSGKSTMAALIGAEMKDPYLEIMLPGLNRKAIISKIGPPNFLGGVLFLDEIHALSKKDQELFLSLLGKGTFVNAAGYEFKFNFITVIAATTERDKVVPALLDRFIIKPEFEVYSDEDMGRVVIGMAKRAEVEMSEDVAIELGRACGGIPRHGKDFVFASRALHATLGRFPTAEEILRFCNVEPDGLTEIHRRYLALLKAQNGRAGQRTIQSLLRLPDCREVERLLLEHSLIDYTPTGRVLTPAGQARISGGKDEMYVRAS